MKASDIKVGDYFEGPPGGYVVKEVRRRHVDVFVDEVGGATEKRDVIELYVQHVDGGHDARCFFPDDETPLLDGSVPTD
jgi:hypothetical protein